MVVTVDHGQSTPTRSTSKGPHLVAYTHMILLTPQFLQSNILEWVIWLSLTLVKEYDDCSAELQYLLWLCFCHFCVCMCVCVCVCGLEEGGGGLTFVFRFARRPVNGACTQPLGRLQTPSVWAKSNNKHHRRSCWIKRYWYLAGSRDVVETAKRRRHHHRSKTTHVVTLWDLRPHTTVLHLNTP